MKKLLCAVIILTNGKKLSKFFPNLFVRNKQYYAKLMPERFHVNGNTIEFRHAEISELE